MISENIMKVKISEITPQQVASITDHTFLKTEDAFTSAPEGAIAAREKALDEFLEETARLKPCAVCIRHYDVEKARNFLIENKLPNCVAAVVGFPNPQKFVSFSGISAVRGEISIAYSNGAMEIDFVFPRIESPKIPEDVRDYISAIAEEINPREMVSKLILEVSNYSHRTPSEQDEIIASICDLAEGNNIDIVKTSTDYTNSGATERVLSLMRRNYTNGGIKISGGVKPENYQALLRAANLGNEEIDLDPMQIRIGASGLLPALFKGNSAPDSY